MPTTQIYGEPTLDEVLSDPIILQLMKADGCSMHRLSEVLLRAADRLATRAAMIATQRRATWPEMRF